MFRKIAALVVVGAALLVFIYFFLNTDEVVKETPISFIVSDHFGANIDSTSLNFGTLMPAVNTSRTIILTNDDDHSVQIDLEIKDLNEWISTNETSFVLGPWETKEVDVIVVIPVDVEMGEYESTLVIRSS